MKKTLVIEYCSNLASLSRIFLPIKFSPRKPKHNIEITPNLYFSLPKSTNPVEIRRPTLKVQPIRFTDELVQKILESYLSLLKAKREKISHKPVTARLIGWKVITHEKKG